MGRLRAQARDKNSSRSRAMYVSSLTWASKSASTTPLEVVSTDAVLGGVVREGEVESVVGGGDMVDEGGKGPE